MAEITSSFATGPDIERVAGKMITAVSREDEMLVMISALSLVFLIQDPDLSEQQLLNGVKGASTWIAEFLRASQEATEVPPSQMN